MKKDADVADKDIKYGPQISRINTKRILVTLEKKNNIYQWTSPLKRKLFQNPIPKFVHFSLPRRSSVFWNVGGCNSWINKTIEQVEKIIGVNI